MNHRSDNRRYPYVKLTPAADFGTLYHGEEDELLITGYRRSLPKTILSAILSIVSLGFLQLVFYWKPIWRLRCTSRRCLLSEATQVLLENKFFEGFVEDIKTRPLLQPLTSLLPKRAPSHDARLVGSISEQSVDIPVATGDAERYQRWRTSSSGDSELDDDRKALIGPPKEQIGEDEHSYRFFEHKKVVYHWHVERATFVPLRGLEEGTLLTQFHEDFKGYSKEDQSLRQEVYGPNEIYIKVKSYFGLFVQEILNPFYIFQVFSLTLWFLEDYYYYAVCIIVILQVSMVISLYETKKQSITLRDMVAHSSQVTVLRSQSGLTESIDSRQLVPGDVLVIPRKGCIMSCDAALVSGNCIVNESMLTGESVPITKTPVPNPPPGEGAPMPCFDPEQHKRHTLFGGTHIIQTRSYGPDLVKAVVIRTGFNTMKGDLVRSILYPKPVGFVFYRDSMKFIGLLFLLAMFGIIYSVVILIHLEACDIDIIYKALDILTIAVPPSLPAAMTVGTIYAQARLKKQGIFCISPLRINVCGKLKLICFDKTGTLTEDGLDLWGVVSLQDQHFLPAVQRPSELSPGHLVTAMATCHSLTIIDGKLSGDPLDLIMFEATNWVLEEPNLENNESDTIAPTVVRPPTGETMYPSGDSRLSQPEIGIVRQFPFASALQRMSVVVRALDADHMDVYAKGSPEMIASLCNKNSIPLDFHDVLGGYTQEGFRVLALAWRSLDPEVSWHHVHKVARRDIESDLTFLGLLVMRNTLKGATSRVIKELQSANIRTVMVTGDNMLTAISVAKECRMVLAECKVITVNATAPSSDAPARIRWIPDDRDDSDIFNVRVIKSSNSTYQSMPNGDVPQGPDYCFALNGDSFRVLCNHFPELLPKVVQRGTVFARMSPDQKAQLVEELQKLSYCVGMCGDGANDCGALKTAHAGISLSEMEASVASPFTSRVPDISCVPVVIKEGRAALVTSFGVFKFMALYSIIQFVSVVILYWINSNLGDLQFLYVDLVITTTVAILMGHNGAYPRLVKRRPPGSLFSLPIMLSILLQVTLVALFQITAYVSLHYQPWFDYTPHTPEPCSAGSSADDNVFCPENTVVFIMSSFQYIVLAAAFSKGPPYRLPIWRNYLFILDLIFLTIATSLLLLIPARGAFLSDVLQIDITVNRHIQYPLFIVCLVALYSILALTLETFIVDSDILKSCLRRLRCKRRPKNKFKLVEKELLADPTWPPLERCGSPNEGNQTELVDEIT